MKTGVDKSWDDENVDLLYIDVKSGQSGTVMLLKLLKCFGRS